MPIPLAAVAIMLLSSRKRGRGRSDDGRIIHAFKTLMNDLATLTKNTVRMEGAEVTFEQYARPTELQQRALDLLDVPVRL